MMGAGSVEIWLAGHVCIVAWSIGWFGQSTQSNPIHPIKLAASQRSYLHLRTSSLTLTHSHLKSPLYNTSIHPTRTRPPPPEPSPHMSYKLTRTHTRPSKPELPCAARIHHGLRVRSAVAHLTQRPQVPVTSQNRGFRGLDMTRVDPV